MNTRLRNSNKLTGRYASGRGFFTVMALLLMFSGLISPLIPVVQASTASNFAEAEQAAAIRADGNATMLNQADPPPDRDQDGIPDDQDSCISNPNTGMDWDQDGIDDACDPPPADGDMDGVPDGQDSCPNDVNLGTDWDQDGIDDACDPQPQVVDTDNDGIADDQDSCPNDVNLGTDWDQDGIDDACDPQPQVVDTDNDGIADDQDTCPNDVNLGTDWDQDGIDDACDPQPVDTDSDGIADDLDSCPNDVDVGVDSDGDGLDDACDPVMVQEEPVDFEEYLVVDLNWCPEGTDLASFPSDSEGPGAICSEPGHDATVVLQSTTDPSVNLSLMAPASTGYAEFRPVPVDTWQIHVEPSIEISDESMHCATFSETGNTKPYASALFALSSAPDTYKLFDAETEDAHYTYCFWYGVPQQNTGDIRLMKYACATEVAGAPELQDYVDTCTMPLDDVPFTLDMPDPTPDIEMMTNSSDFPGTLLMEDIEPGSYTLTEGEVPGYESLAVFCATPENPDVAPIADEYSDYPLTDSGVTVDVVAGKMITCYWFNQVVDEEIPAKIYVDVYWCPEHVDLDTVAHGDDIKDECVVSGPDVTVNLALQSDPATAFSDTISVFPGSTEFLDLPFDTWNLSFATTDLQKEALFCEGNHSHGNTKPYARFFASSSPSPGDPFSLPTESDETIECEWFGQTVDPNMVPTLAGYGDLRLLKFECTTVAPSGSTVEWYDDNCTTPMNGVPFTLDKPDPDPDITTSTNDTGTPGYIQMLGVEEGTYPLIEGMVPGASPLAAFCADVDPTNVVPDASLFTEHAIAGDQITVTIVSERLTACLWYNLVEPADEGISLTLYKWECPAGTMYGQMEDYYSAECATQQAGVPFQITDDGGTQDTTSDIDGRQIDNLNGEITIQETIPAGFGDPVVYCQLLNDPASTLYPSTMGTVTLPAATDDDYQCFWYNLPIPAAGGYGDLRLMKYECPSAAPAASTVQWYIDNCTTTMDGVPFTLDKPDPDPDITTSTNDTGTPGYIQMLGVDAGTYPLVEGAYPGYEPLAVYCASTAMTTAPTTADYVEYPLSGTSITVMIAADMQINCNWYNIAADGHSLTIYKWECAVGTMYGQLEDYYSAECATQQAGVPFQITDDSGTQDTTSDIDGRQIDNLSGGITIQETIPAGFGDTVVYCKLLNDPASTLYPSTVGTVTLPAATHDDYQCFWYNIPGDGPTLTIYKYECPDTVVDHLQPLTVYQTECVTEQPGVSFEVKDVNGTQTVVSAAGGVQISGLTGLVSITEIIPTGFGIPAVFCQTSAAAGPESQQLGGPFTSIQMSETEDVICWYYNIPELPGKVTIYKWRCPDGMPAESTQVWFETNCTTAMDGVTFSMIDSKGAKPDMTTTAGKVEWLDVSTGAVQITEHVPSGYDPHPFLVCVITVPNMPPTTVTPRTVNGTWNTTITEPGTEIVCNWYNWYLGPGEITVYKYTCPAGYDRNAWGADPMVDCTQLTNGITFVLDQPDPEVDLQSNTGDSINGAVYFGGLTPGNYTLTEMLAMDSDMKDVFVWQCVGLTSSAVHPVPLSVGDQLAFTITGGDKIECSWFNVPYPEYGWMDVYKFNCTTQTYVKDVYCYTNQTGQEFNLQIWVNGSGWSTVQSGVTDVNGKLTFIDLQSGAYQLVEPNGKACLMKSSNITSGGYIGVNQGEGTTVYVYNCKTPPPPQTGKTPTKYPNTGVGPQQQGELTWTPGLELTGLLGLLGMHLTRRRMVAGAGLAAAATLPLVAAQDLQPLTADPTPVPGTPEPEVFGCAGTPEAWTQAVGTPGANSTPVVDPCDRGAIPIQMRIPIIGVDAPMEYLEIIDGQMQQPTGDTHITWYKDTSRLGEVGNGIYAAHLNWWGNPEGIFFRLESLQEGDVIEIDGDDQQTHLFTVQWMQNFPSTEEPPQEALGFTEDVAITLITCGGEWSSAVSEYDHRTLVRAVLRE